MYRNISFRKHSKKLLLALIVAALFFVGACEKENETPDPVNEETIEPEFVSAVDISRYPEIREYNPVFYDLEGKQKDFLTILKENGVNTIRLKLWVDPEDGHAGFSEVKSFSAELKSKGFKIWLSVHYSDTWADPGKQITPARWQNLNLSTLKDSVAAYTQKVVATMNPDYIQIGNEINSGFLHPLGNISNPAQLSELLGAGIEAVRSANNKTKIMLHFAGLNGADWFFNQLKNLDFDIIALSYYPWWHQTSLADLETGLDHLSDTYNRDIIIAETAYPFTLGWNDWTNNIIGMEGQLTTGFPATEQGQQDFIRHIHEISMGKVDRSLGFCYWGGEQIAWKGSTASDASAWENLALFDFNNKALPVFNEFRIE